MKYLAAVVLLCSCAHGRQVRWIDDSEKDDLWACMREAKGEGIRCMSLVDLLRAAKTEADKPEKTIRQTSEL